MTDNKQDKKAGRCPDCGGQAVQGACCNLLCRSFWPTPAHMVTEVSPEMRALSARVAQMAKEAERSGGMTDAEIDDWALKLAKDVAHAKD